MTRKFKLLLALLMLTSSTPIFAAEVTEFVMKSKAQVTINVGQVYAFDLSGFDILSTNDDLNQIRYIIGDESIVAPIGWLDSQANSLTARNKFRFVGTKQGKTTIVLNTANLSGFRMTSVVIEVTVKDSKPEMLILQKNLQMEVDNTQTLTPAFYPSGTSSNVTWYSTNSNVVSVEGGLLTAKAVGQATITCITDNGLREDCNVTVTPKLAQAISMNTSRVTMKPGDTYQFATTITPEADTQKRVVWRSLNPSVVSVDENGLAQCIGEGWTLVTATTTDGTYLTTGCFVQAGKSFDGDLNNDNQIDVSDVNLLIDIILGKA